MFVTVYVYPLRQRACPGGGYVKENVIGRRLREIGWADAQAGKPIEAFYDVPNVAHTEGRRASYEIGYRAAKEEMRRKV